MDNIIKPTELNDLKVRFVNGYEELAILAELNQLNIKIKQPIKSNKVDSYLFFKDKENLAILRAYYAYDKDYLLIQDFTISKKIRGRGLSLYFIAFFVVLYKSHQKDIVVLSSKNTVKYWEKFGFKFFENGDNCVKMRVPYANLYHNLQTIILKNNQN